MKKSLFCMVAAVGCTAFASGRVDSTCYLRSAWDPRTWGSLGIWGGYQYAQGGGIASFALNGAPSDRGQSENTFKQDVAGLTLKGLDFAMFYAYWIGGNEIAFCGAAPWVCSYRTDSNYATPLMTFKGDGTNVLVKTGIGKLSLGAAPKNFAAVDVAQGTLMVTDSSGADTLCANGVPVEVSGGTLNVTPATSGGSTRIASLRNSAGAGSVSVANGTLTVDSLTKDKGAVLVVSKSGSGKFLVSGKESATAPDGGLVALSGNAVSFLDYDATDGWKAGSSVPTNARVFGTAADAANTTHETGALTFDDEGYVWRPASAGETLLKVTGPITAPGGVTFASAAVTGTRPTVDFTGVERLDGKLRFAGFKVAPNGMTPARVAPTAKLSVYSSSFADGCTGGLQFDAENYHHSEPFDCTLRFFGYSDSVPALKAEGHWSYKTLVLRGPDRVQRQRPHRFAGDAEHDLLRRSGCRPRRLHPVVRQRSPVQRRKHLRRRLAGAE